MPGALAGLRVVEMGQIISGPFCGHLFADHGAEVIKVEPPDGDVMRQWGAMYKEVGLYWPVIGRGKRSVTADLRTSGGQEAARQLLATADVLIENFRPGTLERWGLGPHVLQARNPDLVIVRISGFGQTGPYRDRAGFGSIGEAMSGFRHLSGEPGRQPVRVGISLADALAGTHGFTGALMALLRGALNPAQPRGQVIDVALYEAMWMYMESVLPEWDKLSLVRQPSGALLPGIAPSSVYPTADGTWIVIGGNADAVFQRLALLMGRGDWAADAHPYRTHLGRGQAQAALDGEIAAWTATRPAEELLRDLESAGVPAGRIYTAPDIAGDPHYAARNMVVSVPQPTLGGETVAMQGVIPKLSATPGSADRGAPLLGADDDTVWPAVLDPGQLDALRAAGAIGRAADPESVSA